ncbi:MAG: dTMP kinase, partial [Thermicanus sp.]|nr:dTMP kinase [Thermicanus sp.]
SLTLYLDLPPEVGLARVYRDGEREVNRLDMESLQFHRKVREGYLVLADHEPERVKVIDAGAPLEEVVKASLQILLRHVSQGRE